VSKRIRNKHQNIISLLHEATEAVARLLPLGRIQECLILLGDCQESAIALGSHIEKLYGMETKTVKALEIYCEALYQVSVTIEESSGSTQAIHNLAQATQQIQTTYDQEFPENTEVVFLPYKAAMWDSLESVWMAACDDENCDAYVVPIPYYDLDANRNFKEMHYEGDLYPDYVSVTHYADYDLEERHPDMIFIHNPYDQFNTVTSVEPEYYSSKIKDYTDKLVYIPYFVLGEVDPDNAEAVEKMAHFCFVPAVLHADVVVVQSEKMRQIYINEFYKQAKKQNLSITREELEKKILGLGSPKFDRVANTNKEDIQIPDDWKKLIEKPDGSWKKIIFYNTSLTAFLEDGEQMLAKIQDVLHTFYENKEDVTLLWRPHPLMQKTVAAMRPDLWKKYEAIVEKYRAEGWGIYDDTPDMDKAVQISDGYYGDPSSVVQVYQKTGKPIMIQNVEILN